MVDAEQPIDVVKTTLGRANSLRFLESLATHANDYAAIVTPSHPKWGAYDQNVRKYVDHISQELKMKFIRPLMLAIASRFDPTETYRAFRLLTSWVIRFLISGGSRSGVVEKAFGEAAVAITNGGIKAAKTLSESVLSVVPSDARFYAAFCTKTLTSSKLARFILRELEAEVRGDRPESLEAPITDTSKLSLEHILPKNLAAAGWGHFSNGERKIFSIRIGNLVLLNAKDNGAINDKPFVIKRPVIERSKNFMLTADVLERTVSSLQWTAEDINGRQKRLAGLAVTRWPLNTR